MVFDPWIVAENWRGFRDVVLGGIPVPMASPVKDDALQRANLVAYVERLRNRYFAGAAHRVA